MENLTQAGIYNLTYYYSDKCLGRKGEDSCCTRENPCNEGEGDCDNDYHCAEGLVCGNNNCQNFTKDAKSDYDCCVKKGYFIHYMNIILTLY